MPMSVTQVSTTDTGQGVPHLTRNNIHSCIAIYPLNNSTPYSSSSSSATSASSSASSSNDDPGTLYSLRICLFGSLTRTYLPSGCDMHISTMVRTIPQPLERERFICAAKSRGFQPMTPRITWRSLDLGLARETNLGGVSDVL